MRVRFLAELQEVEEVSARFTGLGFSTGRMLTPESAAQHHQEALHGTDLVDGVPESLRRNFERLRELHAYGVLHYDLYTLVEQTHPFVFEHALRDRFIAHYAETIPFQTKTRDDVPLEAASFQQVYGELRWGSHKKAHYLNLDEGRLEFDGSLQALISWARAIGYLRGARNRFRENALVDLRNHFAHPEGFSVTSPIESARAIRSLAETINHMWGNSTASGDWYPAPIAREVMAFGSSPDGNAWCKCRPHQIGERKDEADWNYKLVLGVSYDEGLWDFDTEFEASNLPAELLWGPGPGEEALQWFDSEQPNVDAVDYLDRIFAIRVNEKSVDLPRRMQVACGLPEERQIGEWYVVKADYPLDAFGHVRSLVEGNTECSAHGPCRNCSVTTLAGPALLEN